MAKRRKMNPNRFQKHDDSARLFAFDPLRQDLIKWGLVAGGLGGIFLIQQGLIWQIVGLVIIVFTTNSRINRAAERIPRWHAVINSFIGVLVAMFVVVMLGTIVLAYLGIPTA
ncbi:MAG: hypothetical protein R3264_00555 [Anaerolineae bacterium]|nr:hypothetical protein [Anaerolineae bacterium]